MLLVNLKLKYFAVCLVMLALFISAPAQKKPVQKDALAVFEKNIEQGKLDETERPLLDFALADPQNARALELFGRLRFRQNRLSEAKALYERVLMLDKNFTAAKINYGMILFRLGKIDEARQTLNEIDASAIKDQNFQLNFAQALTLVGEFQKALNAAEKLPVNLKNSDALPILAACYLELGNKAKLDALLPLTKKLIASKPEIPVKFAEILLDAQLNPQALELLRAITTAAPNNTKALMLLGKAEIYTKDFAAAKKHFAQVEILQPQEAEVFYLQAMLEEAQGNSAAALNLLEKSTITDPNSPAYLSKFIVAAMRNNKSRKALDASEKLLDLRPSDPEALYLHGAASLQNGRLESAQKSLEQLMQIRPDDSRGCLVLGLTLAAQPDLVEQARRQLERCLEIDPANYEAKYQLGLSYKAQGDTPKAIKYLEESVAIAPDYPLALRDLGTVYLQAGEEQKAKTVLEKSVSLAPNDSETHFQLSRLYNLLGEPNLARQHLETFQKLKSSGGNLM